jgi:hypothetical protein
MRRRFITLIANQGPSDTTAPTCVITSAAATVIAAAFTCTFTFSEDVQNFALGDITVSNGTAGTFNTVSASVYTAVITPTATGTVTVDVQAGVCTDLASNPNEASNTFSILYVAAHAWYDFADISTLFQDAARTTPVTADADPIGGVADKSGSGKHAAPTLTLYKPTYKVNRQNGKSAALGDGSEDDLTATLTASTAWTIICVAKNISTIQANGRSWSLGGATVANLFEYGAGTPANGWAFYNPVVEMGVTSRTTAIVTVKLTDNTQGNWKINNGSWSANFNPADFDAVTAFYLFWDNSGGANGHSNSDMYEIFAFRSALSDAAVSAIISYLNTKWVVF